MTADTLNEMILGFSVILGVLAVYILSLALRIKRARSTNQHLTEEKPEA